MKRTIKTRLAILLLLAISCTKENIQSPADASTQVLENSVTTHYIGQDYGGGIIFYIDSTGKHGLIAAKKDLGELTWCEKWIYINTGARSVKIGSGARLTRKIVEAQGNGVYAALRCKQYEEGGYSDWFLPSYNELFEMYKQRALIGGFQKNQLYWSSTEINPYSDALVIAFRDSISGYASSDKSFIHYVRAARTF